MPLSNDESWTTADLNPDEYTWIGIDEARSFSCIKVVKDTRLYSGTRTLFKQEDSDDMIVQKWMHDRESKPWMFFGAVPTAKSYGLKTDTTIHYIADSECMYRSDNGCKMRDDHALVEWDENKLSSSTLSSITESLAIKGQDVHKTSAHSYKGVPFAYTAGKIGVVMKFTLTCDFNFVDMTNVHNLSLLHELGKELRTDGKYDEWNKHLEHGWYDQKNDKYRRQSTYDGDFGFLYMLERYIKEYDIANIHGITSIKNEDSVFHSEICMFDPWKAIQKGKILKPVVHERPLVFENGVLEKLSLPSLEEFVSNRKTLGNMLTATDVQKGYIYSNFAYGVRYQ
ncbi:hypothetical protein CYMTET_55145 [Cymbomonas tetramitiformis]|uniref:Uncharacterized protein n=1 Tax=Cymbomonas tetramitiformis TaxID=36881 RepID=A0AAE0ENM9_9CHLO|nr:hypothetical protein CYMTET_55145 [Cymbomonas tetramitiformis]